MLAVGSSFKGPLPQKGTPEGHRREDAADIGSGSEVRIHFVSHKSYKSMTSGQSRRQDVIR